MKRDIFELVGKKWLSGSFVIHSFTHSNLDKALLFSSRYCKDRAMDLVAVGPKNDSVIKYFKNRYDIS